MQALLRDGESEIYANNALFTDSWAGNKKTLVVVHQNTSGLPVVEIITEDQFMDTSIFLPELEIIKAAYGLGDVTDVVKSVVSKQGGKRLNITAINDMSNDTWINTQKALVVVYRFGGDDYQMAIRKENENLCLSFV